MYCLGAGATHYNGVPHLSRNTLCKSSFPTTNISFYYRFNVDKEDHSYLQQKLANKEDELSSMISNSYKKEEMSVRYVWRQSFHSSTNS